MDDLQKSLFCIPVVTIQTLYLVPSHDPVFTEFLLLIYSAHVQVKFINNYYHIMTEGRFKYLGHIFLTCHHSRAI